jgi:hypothetical protein
MPGKQKAAAPVADPHKPASATPAKASQTPAHPVAEAQGATGNRAVAATLQSDTNPAAAPGGGVEAPAKAPADRQVREIVLNKAEKVLEYHLGDGSTQTEALLWYADFPQGAYIAKALHDRPLHWASPPQLSAYIAEAGRGYSVLTDRADRAKNTATFDGVDDFDFVVVGARTLPDGGAGELEVDDLLDSAEIRRYLALRGRRGGLVPGRARPDAQLPPEQVAALIRFRDQLSQLTETDWALFARQGPATGPVGTWIDAQEQLDRYVRSPERASALKAESARDAQIQTARAEVDLKRQAAAISGLRGTEKLYEAIVESETTTDENSPAWAEAEAFQKMLDQLEAGRFRSVAEFDAAALELRTVVRRQAILQALVSLKEGERVLKAELQRYRNTGEVGKLATALMTAPADADAAAAIRVRTEYPILRDKVVYNGAKVSKYLENLEELLLQNIEAQFRNVEKSRKALHDDPDLVFRFDLVIDETLEAMGLPRESVQAQLIHARRGVNSTSVLDILQPILMVLCFAAGPLGWIAYAANLASLGIQIYETHEREHQKDLIRTAAHAGRQLATEPRIQGVLDGIASVMEPLGIVAAGLALFHLPEPHMPTPTGGPPRGASAPPRLPAGEGGPLAIPELGPQVSRAERGAVEIVHSNQRGMLRITRDGYEVYLDPTSRTPTFARKWGDHNLTVPPAVLEQHPHLAGLRDIDRVTLGGQQFGVGVSPDGWFVYAPGTRNTLVTGEFGALEPLSGGPKLLLGDGRVTTQVSGLEQAADFTKPARGVTIRPPRGRRAGTDTPEVSAPSEGFTISAPAELTEAEKAGNKVIRRTVRVEGPNDTHGDITRSWDPKTNTWSYVEDKFDEKLPRWVDTDPPLVQGRGTPLETYLTMALMNWLKARGLGTAGRRLVRLEGVYNLPSVAQLAWATMHEVPLEKALLTTKTVQYAENAIIQSGGRIVRARITNNPLTLPWRNFTTEAQRAALLQDLGLQLPLDMRVTYAYDVELTVEPTVDQTPAPAPPVTPDK